MSWALADPRIMLCFETFKEKLGDIANNMTEEEIRNLMERLELFSDIVFDIWLEKVNDTETK
jgi:hypothetical protein